MGVDALAEETPLCLPATLPHPSFVGQSEAGAVVTHSGGSGSLFGAVACSDYSHIGGIALDDSPFIQIFSGRICDPDERRALPIDSSRGLRLCLWNEGYNMGTFCYSADWHQLRRSGLTLSHSWENAMLNRALYNDWLIGEQQ